jgi:predicted Zn-dependent protease
MRVYIMNVPQFNASMAPNGMMLVWTGALLRIRNEAELAFVLGHEAGHFRAQHSIRQWRRMKDTSALVSAFSVLAYGFGAPNTAMLGSLAAYASVFKFSRDMEREADRLGFEEVVENGYTPQAGAGSVGPHGWREKHVEVHLAQSRVRSHPATEERWPSAPRGRGRCSRRGRTRRAAYRTATRPFLENWLDGDSRSVATRARCWSVRKLLRRSTAWKIAACSPSISPSVSTRGFPGDRDQGGGALREGDRDAGRGPRRMART